MNLPRANTEMSQVVFLPDELIVEILSYLPVKPLVRSKSVCKSWNSLISDPKFGKLRLQRSTRNSHIAVIKYGSGYRKSFVTFPLNHLLENLSITVASNSYDRLKFNKPSRIVGSCNGLLCLLNHTIMSAVPKSWFSTWKGVYLSGTINWLATQCKKDMTFEQFVIISLDLGTEKYKKFQTPRGVDEVPDVEPTIAVLMDCLCFSHNLKNTHFVIWQMTEFGVERSWTQFLKISFQNLQVDDRFSDWIHYQSFMFPLWLSKNGDTLLLANSKKDQAILYNLRDNRVERTSVDEIAWKEAICYVQSKDSIC